MQLERTLQAYTGIHGRTRTIQYTQNGMNELRILDRTGKTMWEFTGENEQIFLHVFETATNADPKHLYQLLIGKNTPYNPLTPKTPERCKSEILRETTRKAREKTRRKK